MRLGLPSIAIVLLLAAHAAAAQAPAQNAVDLQLVLAVDASGSVNQTRFELQRHGYASAFRNPRVVQAITAGAQHAIAVAMVQWTGPTLHVQVVDWTRVSDTKSAEALAAAIDAAPRRLFGGGTSLSGAIDYAMSMLGTSPYRGARRVIDVSGDGSNNAGRPAALARDEAVKSGVVINGLPIIVKPPEYIFPPQPPEGLEVYYRRHVVGGEGHVVIESIGFDNFKQAILQKLLLEIG